MFGMDELLDSAANKHLHTEEQSYLHSLHRHQRPNNLQEDLFANGRPTPVGRKHYHTD
jgi:hypothetical protein